MKNSLNNQELYSLYTKLKDMVEEIEENNKELDEYLVYEPGVLALYEKMLEGTVSRKDFLIFAIHDMYPFVEKNYTETFKSTLLSKFKRYYGDREF